MNDSKIIVSVICNTYNHEKYIRDALESFLNQETNFKFEVLVHDDCSTDNTAKIIKEYEEKYPDVIKPIYQKENQYSKNIDIIEKYQLPRAKGKYFALCEGDDYWIDMKKLQKQFDFLENHSDYSLCVHNAVVVNNHKKKIGYFSPVKTSCDMNYKDFIFGGGQVIATSSIFSYTKYFQTMVKNVTNFTFDFIVQIYLSCMGKTYCFCDIMSAYRRGVAGSWTYRNIRDENSSIECSQKIISALKNIYENIDSKYYEGISRAIIREEVVLFRKQRNKESLEKEPYKSAIKTLNFEERIAIFLNIKFPKIYRFLKKAYIKFEDIRLYKVRKI